MGCNKGLGAVRPNSLIPDKMSGIPAQLLWAISRVRQSTTEYLGSPENSGSSLVSEFGFLGRARTSIGLGCSCGRIHKKSCKIGLLVHCQSIEVLIRS